jgi:exopolyphosphatase/guanosine-5'-triphosphate,3'-diphosphate pyrophosphatase
VARFTVDQLLARYPQPERHTEQVQFLARRLFEELRPLHGLGEREALVLEAAAELHDIGTAVSYYRHHKHGAYLLGAVPLSGFDHREQALIILLVRYHQKGMPKIDPFRQVLVDADTAPLRQLTICLRLAEFLERSRAGRVRDLSASIAKDRVRLRLRITEQADVEMAETRKQAPLFRAAFHRRLELRAEAP